MSRNPSGQRQKLHMEEVLGEALIRSGLAGLIPRNRQRRDNLWIKLMLLFLGFLGLLGLPLGAVLLCLVLALTIEAVDYARRHHCPLPKAFARPFLWERSRPPFYWPLAVGIGLVAVFAAEELLITGLLRGGLQWLCFRGIEDSIRHPERYGSMAQFWRWLKRGWHHIAHVLSVWLILVVLAILASLILNLSARGIWESLGNLGWSRLLIFGGGLYLIALLAFLRLSRLMVRSAVQDSVENWSRSRASNLHQVLRSIQPLNGTSRSGNAYKELITARLGWKNVGNLVSRVSAKLGVALAEQFCWTGFVASLLAFALVMFWVATSLFLIVPRNVMQEWASAGQANGPRVVLAFDDLEEFTNEEFANRLRALDWSEAAQEPLLKVAFFEAAIVVSAILFYAASTRSRLRALAELDPWTLYQRLAMGIGYLILVENEFQYLGSGFVIRELTGAQAPRTLTLRNKILLAPSASTKLGVYRALCDFLQIYGLPTWKAAQCATTIVANYHSAQEWSARFVQPPPLTMDPPDGADQAIPSGTGTLPKRFWIWSGEKLVDLTSLVEAQWYGRFVPR